MSNNIMNFNNINIDNFLNKLSNIYIINDVYSNLMNQCYASKRNFAILKISINDNELCNKYYSRVHNHNMNFLTNKFMDSGFDVYVPIPPTLEAICITQSLPRKYSLIDS